MHCVRQTGGIDRANFFGQFFTGGERAVVGFQGEGVLKFACQAEFAGQNFGGIAHVQTADGIGQPELKSNPRFEI